MTSAQPRIIRMDESFEGEGKTTKKTRAFLDGGAAGPHSTRTMKSFLTPVSKSNCERSVKLMCFP